MVRLFLSFGADPTALDANGDRPLLPSTPKNTKSAFNDALFSSIAQHEYICLLQTKYCVSYTFIITPI